MKKDSSWKQFGTVFRFELANFLRNKVFLGLTIFLILGLAVLLFFPRITGRVPGAESAESIMSGMNIPGFAKEGEKKGTLLVREGEKNPELVPAFGMAFPEYDVEATELADDEIRAAVSDGKAAGAFLLNEDNTAYNYVVANMKMYDMTPQIADEVLKNVYIAAALEKSGVSGEEAAAIMTTQITHETEVLEHDQSSNFFYTYIMIMALYMVIIIYGQIVAGSVASEKTSRAMELLITSARAKSLMFGKILAAGLAGLIQLTAIFGAALLFFNLNKSYWTGTAVISSMFNIPPYLLVFMLIFFVLGYFLYACLYGAFGSTVTKAEDVQMATMPAMFGILIMFMVVIIGVSSGTVDSTLMKVCSFIPFTSPMAMFARVAMSTVPPWQIALSIAILVATVYAIGVLAAKIYRMGVLLYGNTMKPMAVIKALVTAEKAK